MRCPAVSTPIVGPGCVIAVYLSAGLRAGGAAVYPRWAKVGFWLVPRRVPARVFRRYGVPVSQSAWDSVDDILDDWARERPDLDFTPVGVITRLGRVRSHVARQLAAVFADHGLTPADFRVLVNLRRSGAPYRMPQARLMEALGLTSGTVSVRLDRLTKAGTVAREPDPEDRRGSLIRLTEDGLRLFDALAPEHLANEDRLLSAQNGSAHVRQRISQRDGAQWPMAASV
jgi:DNA-binding MarR family transcriptional regulator